MAKITKVAMRDRVKAVQRMLLRGYTRSHIHKRCLEVWGIEERQADVYIKQASDNVSEVNKNDAETNLALLTSNLWELYRTHMDAFEYAAARVVLLDIGKLRGLDRTEINLHIDRPHKDLTDAELAAAAGLKEEG